ncbi:hypothetical protein [Vibrio sonorensis]|uniref:hypothetical protein n=1 Tax=Vibrio sonorensis TaxID=1004316 RepID=UPI00316AECC1
MSDIANERKLAREIASRKAAEKLLEEKSLELHQANQQLKHAFVQLKRQNMHDVQKFEFDDQINDTLIHFGRVFLSRSLDDGLIGSYLSRIQENRVVASAGLWFFEIPQPTNLAQEIGTLVDARAEPLVYAKWYDNRLVLPIEIDYRSIGQLELVVDLQGIERAFIQSRLTIVSELLCNAISREVILANAKADKYRAEESEKATREFVA